MPRVLPWEVDAPTRKQSTPVRPTRRELGGAQRTSTALSSRLNRTPSTSPAREPPSEELMIEGLDADDQYIMVEDEFLATAQAFTAHLHQAEYVRKKKRAKEENATKVLNMTQRRPTDPRMPMNNVTRKNMEREVSNVRRQEALEKMKHDAGRPAVDSEMEDDDEDVGASDEDCDDDPWVGTSLQALMVTSKRPRPLMGLEGLRSSTKAALGYSRPTNTSSGAAGASKDKETDIMSGSLSNIRPRSKPGFADDSTASSDDDDLDMQTGAPSRPPAIQARTKTAAPSLRAPPAALPCTEEAIARADPVPLPIKQPHVDTSRSRSFQSGSSSSTASACGKRSLSPPKPRGSPSSRFAKFFDELDEPAKEPGPSPAKRQVKIGGKDPLLGQMKPFQPEKTGDRDEDEKLRKQRLNQVPTFL
ncbi:hypothetical protein MaudCBS49596_000544 [Microsporum audouinii]